MPLCWKSHAVAHVSLENKILKAPADDFYENSSLIYHPQNKNIPKCGQWLQMTGALNKQLRTVNLLSTNVEKNQ